ncbi:HECT domain containing ubiquitin protein ligase [Cryptosporidium ubiquitum]|uniref:HECT-type E3 ubiquitin transferase n=1 Tax=Cryptosporidium ubiquitum TaxID=857276 RepID=A0A1J4MEE8_9CRYT|nr:HECT domain containing ubiquitin protein ligase [Cryptosporidium ubiquitum]OII72608.1 HECT domain containing ubiquitin protein ligase [Cryptosporidium ubiquitum]
MFGKPNSKAVGGNRLVIGTNVRNNKDLDIPVSFGRSSKDYIISKKKEKEKRIYEKLKSNKIKVITYYVIQHKFYKLTKKSFCDSLENFLYQSQSSTHINLNRIIRLFRFTLETNSEKLGRDIERFYLIIELTNKDLQKSSIQISISNLLFLFRNSLMLIFLDDKNETLKIKKNLLKDFTDQILYLFFSRSKFKDQKVPNNQFKKKDLIGMIFNYSMIDLFFIRYLELKILKMEIETEIVFEILDEIFLLCKSKLSRDLNQVFFYMGNDLLDFPKNDSYLLKKSTKLSKHNHLQIESFFKNRYFWVISCCFSLIFKTKHILSESKIKVLIQTYLGLLDLNSLQNWIMSENQDSIQVVKNPFQLIPPNSPFSLILLNYSFLYHLELCKNKCELSKPIKLRNFKLKKDSEQREITDRIENDLTSIFYIINFWDFSPDILLNIDETLSTQFYTSKDEIIQMISFIFEIIIQNHNNSDTQMINDNNLILIEEKLKFMYLVRLYMLFLDLQGKFLLLGTYIKNIDNNKDKKIFFGNNNQLKESQLLSKNMINQVIQPTLNLALNFACRDETTLKHAINIINLINDIYFPLNQIPNIIFENIYFYNNIFTKNKSNYLHNALDLCIDQSGSNNNNSNSDNNITGSNDQDQKSIFNIIKESTISYHSFLKNRKRPLKENITFQEDNIFMKKIRFFFLIGEIDKRNNNNNSIKNTEDALIKSIRVFHKSQDHKFLEKTYHEFYSNDYHSLESFCDILAKSKLKVLQEMQSLVLNYLSYDTYWVLLLFLSIHNTVIYNYNGNLNSFILDVIESKKDGYNNLGKLLMLFGVSLNHQLLFLDDYEIKKSIEMILLKNSNSTSNNYCDNNYLKIGEDPNLRLIPFLNSNDIMVNSNKIITGISGSEILGKILEDLSNHRNLYILITYKNIQSINIEDDINNNMIKCRNFLIHPILLINNRNQLNYVSLFINNLTFSILKMMLEMKNKNAEKDTDIDNRNGTGNLINVSIFGKLTRRLYQNYLKLNHIQMKLDDPIIKLPWTISEASNLLKPRDVLIKQALHIESLGSFPTNNPGEYEFELGEEDRNRNRNNSNEDDNYDDDDDDDDDDDYDYDSHIINNKSNNNSNYNSNNGRRPARLDLLKVFDSTLKYVSNKSKFELLRQILREMPYLIGFEDRLHFYYHYIAELRFNHYQPEFFHEIPNFEIRRTHIIEDGLNKIGSLDPNRLRIAFRIIFLDEQGDIEPGIDGGGLLKDFITCISKELCSESFGLFKSCKDNTIIPREYDSLMEISNKFKDLIIDEPLSLKKSNIVLYLFEFLGKIVGKAIYEKILLEIEFNPVFLNSVFEQNNDFNDLLNLDEELYKSLNYIKNLENDQEMKNLCLTFSITLDLESLKDGKSNNNKYLEVDLIPNGRNIPVNNENKIVYIKLLTYYKLITSIKLQAESFLRGLSTVIPNESLRLFSPYELQSLISGVYQKLDVNNLRLNTCYTGYIETSQQIIWFWDILENEFSTEEQAEFLLFVTSSRKAPLLGFQHLNPKFGIQIVPDNTRLPSASTCFNLLKLPSYNSKEILKLKLRQAIFNSKGFDLS